VSIFFADGRFTEDREVVAVAADIEYDAFEEDSPGDIYFPASQAAWSGGKIFLRTERPSAAMLHEVRPAVRAAHPQVLVADAATRRVRLGAPSPTSWTVELLASLTHGMPPRDAFAFTAPRRC
jgi:hypothetical protein